MSFNKIILVGNLGKDPELRYTPQGDAVCNLSVATSAKKKDKAGEMQEVTTWFRVTLWRNQAENAAKYLAKGRQVYIEGRLGVEEWKDRDGNSRYTLEVQATEMQFLGGARNDEYSGDSGEAPQFAGPASGSSSSSSAATAPAAADDNIPF